VKPARPGDAAFAISKLAASETLVRVHVIRKATIEKDERPAKVADDNLPLSGFGHDPLCAAILRPRVSIIQLCGALSSRRAENQPSRPKYLAKSEIQKARGPTGGRQRNQIRSQRRYISAKGGGTVLQVAECVRIASSAFVLGRVLLDWSHRRPARWRFILARNGGRWSEDEKRAVWLVRRLLPARRSTAVVAQSA